MRQALKQTMTGWRPRDQQQSWKPSGSWRPGPESWYHWRPLDTRTGGRWEGTRTMAWGRCHWMSEKAAEWWCGGSGGGSARIGSSIHMETLLCVNVLFWNLVSGWKIWKRRPCILVWTATLHTLRIDDSIAPTLDPRPRLHACVSPAEDIESIRVIRAKCWAPLPLRLSMIKGLWTTD